MLGMLKKGCDIVAVLRGLVNLIVDELPLILDVVSRNGLVLGCKDRLGVLLSDVENVVVKRSVHGGEHCLLAHGWRSFTFLVGGDSSCDVARLNHVFGHAHLLQELEGAGEESNGSAEGFLNLQLPLFFTQMLEAANMMASQDS